jgi:hypothetical protein
MMMFHKRQRKAIAPFVLALWVFALFVSVAHACGLDEDLRLAGHSEAATVGVHDGSDGECLPACEQFCSDGLPIVAKLKAVQDGPTGQALVAPSSVGQASQVIPGSGSSLHPSHDPPPGIAINTRFVRLAL